MTELKKCPFCGGDNLGISNNSCIDESFEVCCYDCDCSIEEMYSSREGIVAIWNNRPLDDRLMSENEELREGLEVMTALVERNAVDMCESTISYINEAKALLTKGEAK